MVQRRDRKMPKRLRNLLETFFLAENRLTQGQRLLVIILIAIVSALIGDLVNVGSALLGVTGSPRG